MKKRARLFDPIRKREVDATPEEGVRQALVHYFIQTIKVPERLIAIEFDLRRIDPNQRGRLDLVAFRPGGNGLLAWAIAECKAPEIPINEKTARQLERYLTVLAPLFLIATNGKTTIVLEKKGDGHFQAIPSMPIFCLD